MYGVHQNGDFGANQMAGILDDVGNWFSTAVKSSTAQSELAVKEAEAKVQREKYMMYAGIAAALLLVVLYAKKNKLI